MQCTVPSGYTLYVPSGWHHATLNIGPTVAVGFQQPGWAGDKAGMLLEKFPKSALFNSQVGTAAFNAHRDSIALPLLTKAVRLEPNNFKHASNLISFHLATKQVRTAFQSASEALSRLQDLVHAKLVLKESACFVVSHLAQKFVEFAQNAPVDQGSVTSMGAYASAVKLFLEAQKLHKLEQVAQESLDLALAKTGLS